MNMRQVINILTCLLLSAAVGSTAFADWDEGVAAFEAKNYQEAANQFQAFLQNAADLGGADKPEYAQVYFMLGRSMYYQKKYKEAIDPLKTALKLKPDVSTQLVLGQAYFRANDYKNTIDVFSKINAGSLPQAHQQNISKMLTVCYEKTGNSGLLLSNLENAAKLNPDDAAIQFNYGTQALAAGYTEDAIKALAKASSLDTKDPAKHRAYATALVQKGRETRNREAKLATYAQAASACHKLTSLESKYDNLLLQSESELGAQQYDQAVKSLGQAIGKNSNDWLPLYYLGQAHTANQDYAQAIEPLKSALGKSKVDEKKVWSQLGFVYEKQKNLTEAKAAYVKAGDSAGANRIQGNIDIGDENRDIEAQNKLIKQLEEEKKALEREMKALPGAGP